MFSTNSKTRPSGRRNARELNGTIRRPHRSYALLEVVLEREPGSGSFQLSAYGFIAPTRRLTCDACYIYGNNVQPVRPIIHCQKFRRRMTTAQNVFNAAHVFERRQLL